MSVFISLAGPIATIIAALAAIAVSTWLGVGQLRIARQQAVTAHDQARLADVRLQHDLFDRRFPIFEAARDLMLAGFWKGVMTNEDFNAFVAKTLPAVFLFDKATYGYIEQMRFHAAKMKKATDRLNDPRPLAVGEDLTRFSKMQTDAAIWFGDQFDVIIEVFKPALALERDIETKIPWREVVTS